MAFINTMYESIKESLNTFYNDITNKTDEIKIRDEYQSKYSTLAGKLTQEYNELIMSEEFSRMDENKKQNALFNLRFEDYKLGVKEQLLKKANLLDNIIYNDPYCKEPENNTYLFIGIVLVIFAILLIKFA